MSPKSQVVFRRASLILLGLAIGVSAERVAAQNPEPDPEPIYSPGKPQWSASAPKQSMRLLPTDAKLGVGLSAAHPAAQLHVVGDDVQQKQGSGSVVIGPTNELHMQIDRNELRVAGKQPEEVGTLHLQRFGGPIALRAAADDDASVVFPAKGGLAIGGAPDPYEIATDLELWRKDKPVPHPPALAVDGYVFSEVYIGREGRFFDLLRVGNFGGSSPHAAYDVANPDAVAMFGGLITAIEIVVHLDQWADDVFSPDYDLMSLADTRAYIQAHHRLPGMPSAEQVLSEGVELGAVNEKLLRKIEELTLHTLAQQDQIDAPQNQLDALKEQIDACR